MFCEFCQHASSRSDLRQKLFHLENQIVRQNNASKFSRLRGALVNKNNKVWQLKQHHSAIIEQMQKRECPKFLPEINVKNLCDKSAI